MRRYLFLRYTQNLRMLAQVSNTSLELTEWDGVWVCLEPPDTCVHRGAPLGCLLE